MGRDMAIPASQTLIICNSSLTLAPEVMQKGTKEHKALIDKMKLEGVVSYRHDTNTLEFNR